MTRVIYPAQRAIEHAVTVPGVRPARLFPVLWPLWQVETAAQVYDEQAYEVIDRFLVRGILEAGLHRSADLAAFYGLPTSLVERCLAFLTLIGHVRNTEGLVTLTPLGESSARADVRYVPKESRQQLLVERFTARPLPRSHYQGSLSLLPTPHVPAERVSDGSRFAPLFSSSTFRPEIVTQLGEQPDRFDFNLPKQLRNLRVLGHQDAYLPAYLIEDADGRLLAYSGVHGERDTFLESLCDRVPLIRTLIAAEPSQDRERSGPIGSRTANERAPYGSCPAVSGAQPSLRTASVARQRCHSVGSGRTSYASGTSCRSGPTTRSCDGRQHCDGLWPSRSSAMSVPEPTSPAG
ncbi:hypothetical protein [Salinispora arenicola]|uniref:hypothetical protein n=1 Tax=Salinispora arenicola TaxID=168697 RepID=UPI0027DD4AC9|nr:hypothetical protein [Salinispora arenicola]